MMQHLDVCYWRDVKRYLYCGRQNRMRFKRQTLQDARSFMKEYPKCTIGDMSYGLGQPHIYAENCMDEINMVERQRARSSWQIYNIAATVFVLLCIWAFLYLRILQSKK